MTDEHFVKRPLVTISKDQTIKFALDKMKERGIRHAIIEDQREPVALVSSSDIAFFLARAPSADGALAESVQSLVGKPLKTLSHDSKLEDILSFLNQPKVSAVLLLKDGQPHMIVTESDVLKLMKTIVEKKAEPTLTEKTELLLVENPFSQKILSLFDAIGL
jgi:CBS domain-containing protein